MRSHGGVSPLLSFPLLCVALLASPAQAHADETPTDPHLLDDWNYQPLYESGGMLAQSLLEARAIGGEGDAIGTIENAILDQRNRIVTLIAEVGGTWESGSRHVSIPWEEVELTAEGVQVPVREDNMAEYDLFDDDYVDDAYLFKGGLGSVEEVEGDVATGPRIWKITDLIDDFASMGKETGFGYITDALITRDGVLQAIVVKPSHPGLGEGPFAYPFTSQPNGWQPGAMHYELPYSREALESLPPFDYARYDSLWE